ncbi:MAG: acyl-CoA thioesterase [Propionibacteriales bacterium]|nr:acyl-CoA thioesterase [Propionibacteriales bacterium]
MTRHIYPCRVRWSDVDRYGHVNNVKYFEYVQEARVAFMSALAEDTLVDLRGGSTFVVARQDVDYKRPILFRSEPYQIETVVTKVGTSSYHLQAEILDGDLLLARARTVVVAFDQQRQRARSLNKEELTALHAVYDGT